MQVEISFSLSSVSLLTFNGLVQSCLDKINTDLSMAAADIDPEHTKSKNVPDKREVLLSEDPCSSLHAVILSLSRVRDESWA